MNTLQALTFTVALLVFTVGCDGKKDPVAKTPELPSAAFTWSGDTVVPTTLSFLNRSENASTFRWYFGDGDSSTTIDPTHVYSSAGNYVVTLFAEQDDRIDSVSHFISLTDPPPPPPAFADFSWTGGTKSPASINFQNLSRNANEFLWHFGNGDSSSLRSPSVRYLTPGIFSITLRASSSVTNTFDIVTKQINIEPGTFILDSILVMSLSPLDSSDNPWDDTNGPDLYINLRTAGTTLVWSTIGSPFNNQNLDSLPVGWAAPDSLILSNWSSSYKIELFDEDRVDADDKITDPVFSIDNLISRFGYVEAYLINSNLAQFKLRVEWR